MVSQAAHLQHLDLNLAYPASNPIINLHMLLTFLSDQGHLLVHMIHNRHHHRL
jgi:hypothetical protein